MNYLLLDTTTPVCRVSIIKNDSKLDYEWQADRTLAHGLLSHLTGLLSENNLTLDDLNGIGALRGPGSFTGLRIGLTVLNTIADSQNIPIVGADGDNTDIKFHIRRLCISVWRGTAIFIRFNNKRCGL